MLSGYRPFPDGFVATVVRDGQLERVAPAFRGAGVVEGVGNGALHRIAFEQDPLPVECGRIAAYAGEVVSQAEGDAARSDRLSGFEAGSMRGGTVSATTQKSPNVRVERVTAPFLYFPPA